MSMLDRSFERFLENVLLENSRYAQIEKPQGCQKIISGGPGKPSPANFCGERCVGETSYCFKHYLRMFQPHTYDPDILQEYSDHVF